MVQRVTPLKRSQILKYLQREAWAFLTKDIMWYQSRGLEKVILDWSSLHAIDIAHCNPTCDIQAYKLQINVPAMDLGLQGYKCDICHRSRQCISLSKSWPPRLCSKVTKWDAKVLSGQSGGLRLSLINRIRQTSLKWLFLWYEMILNLKVNLRFFGSTNCVISNFDLWNSLIIHVATTNF